MAASVQNRISLHPLGSDKIHDPFLDFRIGQKIREVFCPADWLHADHAPGVDIDPVHHIEQSIQFLHISLVNDRRHLYGMESALLDQCPDSPHCPGVRAGASPVMIVGFLGPVNADRDRAHSGFPQLVRRFCVDQRSVAGHSPAKTHFMDHPDDLPEIASYHRFPACDTDPGQRIREIPLHLFEEFSILLERQFIAPNVSAPAAAVKTVLIAV